MKFVTIALTVMLLLSACGTEPSKEIRTSQKLILPDVPQYTKEIQSKAAAEIEGGSCPILGDVLMPDYSVMRDQTRYAKESLKK